MVTQPLQAHQSHDREAGRRFRRTLVRVLGVQVITLVLLWLLQRVYTP